MGISTVISINSSSIRNTNKLLQYLINSTIINNNIYGNYIINNNIYINYIIK